jgi:ribonuclease D
MPANSNQSRFIDDQRELDEICDHLRDSSVITMDTEFVRTQTYYAQLCLVQLATESDRWCIDTLADLNLDPLLDILTDTSSQKILHAAKQDLEAFWLSYHRLPAPIFDTQIGAGLLGFQAQIGYANLVQELIGQSLDKDQTRTDWSRRPLTERQIAYAIDDVEYLAALHDILRTRLTASGRYDWAVADSAAMLDTNLYESPVEDAWQRLSSIPMLPVPVQARARALTTWREVSAKRNNRPRQWILADKDLLSVAHADPDDPESLSRVPGLPTGIARNQGSSIIVALCAANESVAAGDIDYCQQSRPGPPDPQTLKRLSKLVKNTAESLDISPELLATRRDLTALMRGTHEIKPLEGWRHDVIGEKLLAAVSE